MALNYGLYGESTTMKTKMAVAVMLLGVTMATVTDVDVTTTGFVIGMLAVTGAAQQQILIGKIQKQLKASSNQLLVSYTPFVSASNGQMCFACVGWKGRVCGPRVCMFVFGGGRAEGEVHERILQALDARRHNPRSGLLTNPSITCS